MIRVGNVGVFTALLAIGLIGCGREAPPPPQPPAVVVDRPVVRDVTRYFHYTGNTAAVARVDVVARVGGELIRQNYEVLDDAGRPTRVEAGQVLFEIEHEPFEIAVQAAEAEVERARALETAAQSVFDRVEQAFERQASTPAERIEAQATLRQRQAEVRAAEAKLAQAELDLSYSFVKAPIAGEVTRALVDVGNLVGQGGSTVLTRVTQKQPIYVFFDVSETIVQQYLARAQAMGPDTPLAPPPLELATTADAEGSWPHRGVVNWWDRSVDRGTGTIVVRGELANEDGALVPGLFARIRVPFDTIEDAVLVREDAIGSDLSGKFVLVVETGEDNVPTVRKQPVTTGQRADDGLRVVEGLAADATYIVAGLQKVRPGVPVRPQPATPSPTPTDDPATNPTTTPGGA